MIQLNLSPQEKLKAVGLISGGLDSTLAAKIVSDLGFEVHGVYFAMPWGCCDKKSALAAAENIGVKLITLQLDERYLEIIDKPKYGYGTALNPCVDCRIHMFSRAAQYMRHINAEFVFTGEVLGQRPMSQKQNSMKWIEEGAGLAGRLLRPLCAQHMKPTIAEKSGLVDRTKLLNLTGRSRKHQLVLANKYNITQFSGVGGGCNLTKKPFAKRMRDTLDHGYRNFRETIALQWGRHFRLNRNFKAILGRDATENDCLIRYAHPDDMVITLENERGPTLILKGTNPTTHIIGLCGGIIKRYSKYNGDPSIPIKYWIKRDQSNIFRCRVGSVPENIIDRAYII